MSIRDLDVRLSLKYYFSKGLFTKTFMNGLLFNSSNIRLSDSEVKSEIDEDTYSSIFGALRHPIRKKILRMLSERSLSFTEIQNTLSINSAQLSFHIRSLGELTTQTENDKYVLSTFGRAACSLMGKVEETRVTLGRMIEFKWALIAVIVGLIGPRITITPGPMAATSWYFSIGGLIGVLILFWRYSRVT